MSSQLHTAFSLALRKALFAFAILSALAVTGFSMFSWSREQHDIKENLTILSGFLAYASQSFFNDVGNGLVPLADILDHANVLRSPEKTREHLVNFQKLHPEIGAMAIFIPSGEMLINTATAPGQPLPDFRKLPDYFAQLKADMASTERFTIGRPEFGKALQKWRFAFRRVVRNADGSPKFVVQAAIPLDPNSTFLLKLPVPPQSYIGLLREDGYQQARWPVPPGVKAYDRISEGPAAQMIADNPGISSGVFGGISPWSEEDGQRIGAFTKLSDAKMYAYISVPDSYSINQWWRHNAPVFIGLVIGLVAFCVGAYRVTQREKLYSRELFNQARQDPLTGLANRALIDEVIPAKIVDARDLKQRFALLFIDLDRFKNINDAFGHDVGDQLIIAASEKIQSVIHRGDFIGRFGGDEFVVLLDDCDTAASALVTDRILNVFQAPLTVGLKTLQVTPSIGIAVYPDHGSDMETLTKHADTAMYEAKRRGGSAFAVYAEELGDNVRRHLEIEHQLRDALNNEELRLFYQPIVELSSGRVVGAEALLRWQLPDGSFRSPLDFIGIAEDSGLIIPIGAWVLNTACKQLKRWNVAGYDMWVSVNLSARQFSDPSLVKKVSCAIIDSGIDSARLELEITESAAMRDPEMSVKTIGCLKELGVRLSIDDFGTGYSSLSYLKRIPADKIKIDKSFVDGLAIEVEDTAIVRMILALVESLEKTSLAEGIETGDQYHALKTMGCQLGQGYWISKPIPTNAFDDLLVKQGVQFVDVARFNSDFKFKQA
ncbi:MAG: EAL domain-containing protein [Gammaproteobacteria bacterium]|nr:EAL domain-containing protein [Gammaproteobacteria bacterium]